MSHRPGIMRAVLVASVVAGVWLSAACGPARGEVTGDQVKLAVNKAIEYIKNTKGQNVEMGYPGGVPALNVLALLAAGVPESDAFIQKNIALLDNTPNDKTYVVALKAMAYRYAGAQKYQKQLQGCADWLVRAQLNTGTWSYQMGRRAGIGDNSNTQFALLGLHECANGGVAIPKDVWKLSEEYFTKSQCKDGGWAYIYTRGMANGQSTGSMTCAGLASLYITGNRLDVAQENGYVNGVAPNCGKYRQNEAIYAGLGWLANNFAVNNGAGRGGAGGGFGGWGLYGLYAIERVGMISGLKFFGTHDWYREGAEHLVKSQKQDGSWAGAPYDVAFALLFLAKGNKPCLINKLDWGKPGEWNQDRNDIEHLIAFLNDAKNEGQNLKFTNQPLGWQTVNLKAPLVDLLDAPVLFFNGHTFPQFTDEERRKLREFVDQGGTLLAEACCSRKEFADGFRKFAQQVWPEYPVERLPDDHPIFGSFYNLVKNEWGLEGIQVGCRTSVIFAPKDLSCLWEQKDRGESKTAFQIGANVAAYATGLERLKEKLDRPRVAEREREAATPGDVVRGALHIGVLAHGKTASENMTDPNALVKFAESLRKEAKIDVMTRLAIIEPDDAELLNHPIMFMTGHNGFEYSEAQIKAVRTWLDRGGFLFANACCGRDAANFRLPGDPAVKNDFGSSFRKLVGQLYPDKQLADLPADHPIRGGAKGYYPVSQVDYRPEFQKKLLASNPNTAHDLHLEGLAVDGRLVIVYSPYAITCGLEDHKCFGCRGLVSADAYRVATNVVLYALSN